MARTRVCPSDCESDAQRPHQGSVQAVMPQSPDSGTTIAQGESMRRAARKPFRYDAAAFSIISDSSPDWYISMSRSHPPTNSPSM